MGNVVGQPGSCGHCYRSTRLLLAAIALLAAVPLASAGSPPTAQSTSVAAFTQFPANVRLRAADDGLPDSPGSLSYIIRSLPTHGSLADPAGGAIDSVPYTLAGNGGWVTYASDAEYTGPDSFTFVVSDGGTAPHGGESNIATISIHGAGAKGCTGGR